MALAAHHGTVPYAAQDALPLPHTLSENTPARQGCRWACEAAGRKPCFSLSDPVTHRAPRSGHSRLHSRDSHQYIGAGLEREAGLGQPQEPRDWMVCGCGVLAAQPGPFLQGPPALPGSPVTRGNWTHCLGGRQRGLGALHTHAQCWCGTGAAGHDTTITCLPSFLHGAQALMHTGLGAHPAPHCLSAVGQINPRLVPCAPVPSCHSPVSFQGQVQTNAGLLPGHSKQRAQPHLAA